MKITKVELEDFRQFYGRQELEISTDPEKNVTLVHAENGVGKTALLNSILWCFYEKTTAKFEQADRIVNFSALAEGKSVAVVAVSFEHNGASYYARRHFNQRNQRSTFMVSNTTDGKTIEVVAPETLITSVIPPAMAPHFFFDGEAAEAFASETNNRAVGRAVRNMLGFDLAETAIADLEVIARKVNARLGQVEGDDELTARERELETVQRERDAHLSRLDNSDEEIEKLQQEVRLIQNSLRAADSVKQLQKVRDAKEKHLESISQQILDCDRASVELIGQRGIELVSGKLASDPLDFDEEEKTRGPASPPYSEAMIKGLLAAGRCVCGRGLEQHSAEWHVVSALLDSAGTSEVRARLGQLRARAKRLQSARDGAQAEVARLRKRRSQLSDSRKVLEQELAEISEKIASSPVDDIGVRERTRVEIEQRIAKLNREKGSFDLRTAQLEQRISIIESQIRALAQRNSQAKRLYRRHMLAKEAIAYFKEHLAKYEASARDFIRKKVDALLADIARRDYRCELTKDFGLSLLYADGSPVPKSSGENQLLSLAFIASLAHFSSKRTGGDKKILRPGTIAPLILDSPFGQLDQRYREATATFLPGMAQQIVLFVSSSQGDSKVLSALEPHVGAEYLLLSENKAPVGRRSADSIVLRGSRHDASIYGCLRDMTRIKRLL